MSVIQENMGGVIQVEFAEIQNITDFPIVVDNICQTEIVFADGTGWDDPINVANKSQFSNSSSNTDQGYLHPAELSVIIPKYNADNKPILHFTKLEIVKVTFSNGDIIIMGLPSHPIIPAYSANTGLVPPDRNEVVMTFVHTAPVPCPFYNF